MPQVPDAVFIYLFVEGQPWESQSSRIVPGFRLESGDKSDHVEDKTATFIIVPRRLPAALR